MPLAFQWLFNGSSVIACSLCSDNTEPKVPGKLFPVGNCKHGRGPDASIGAMGSLSIPPYEKAPRHVNLDTDFWLW